MDGKKNSWNKGLREDMRQRKKSETQSTAKSVWREQDGERTKM